MARVHYWQFLSDSEGKPIYAANIGIYLAGSEEAAYIYVDEIGGEATSVFPQLKTNVDGFFEFWIGDTSEQIGYSSSQKFKLVWERIGIEEGMIDYIDIFPITLPVDVSDDNPERNKSVSNLLAKGWESHKSSIEHVIHGINEINLHVDVPKRNKLVSNSLGILWQNHRLYSFNTSTVAPSADESLTEWEYTDSNMGAHGLQNVEVSGPNRASGVYNKLVNNALCNKWDEHTNFNFETYTLPMPGTNELTAHGLMPINMSKLPEDATEEDIAEYDVYNKLMNNRLLNEILENIASKPTTFVNKIKKDQWKASLYEPGVYSYKLFHGLDTEFIAVSLFHPQERFIDNGKTEIKKAQFSPEDIYILNKNEIELYVTRLDDVEVMISAHSTKLNITGIE